MKISMEKQVHEWLTRETAEKLAEGIQRHWHAMGYTRVVVSAIPSTVELKGIKHTVYSVRSNIARLGLLGK